jgi:hypothetical protein
MTPFDDIDADCERFYPRPSCRRSDDGAGLVIVGYVLPLLALLIFPPFLGAAGLVVGVINAGRGHAGHGCFQVILSIVCALVGMLLSVAYAMGRL